MNVESPSGCVHSVEDSFITVDKEKMYRTLCNHRNHFKSFEDVHYHNWKITLRPVTCKRCMAMKKEKAKYNDTQLLNFLEKIIKQSGDIHLASDSNGFYLYDTLWHCSDDIRSILTNLKKQRVI